MKPELGQVMAVKVEDRIVQHLKELHLEDLGDGDFWPFGATQDGIAKAIGKSRAHVALELKRTEAKGRVIRFFAHVKGLGVRRLVYRPGNGTILEMMEENGKTHRFAIGTIENVRTVVTRCPGCGMSLRIILDANGAHAGT